jgi:hypothetical protein
MTNKSAPGDFLQDMETSLVADTPQKIKPVEIAAAGTDWYAWRKRNFDVGVAKTGEEGSLEDWQNLLRHEGADKLTSAVSKARSSGRQGDRIWYSRVLEYLADPPAASTPECRIDSAAAKTDLLIWCVAHSPVCYADARCQWRDGDGMVERSVRTPYGGTIMTRVKERVCVQGQSAWEKMRDRAAEAQAWIYSELKLEICNRVKPYVYETLRSSDQWKAYLRSQKLIA